MNLISKALIKYSAFSASILFAQTASATIIAFTEVPTYWRLVNIEGNSVYSTTPYVSISYGTATKTNNGTTLWPSTTGCYGLQLGSNSANNTRLFNFILLSQQSQIPVTLYYDAGTCIIQQFATPQT